MARPKGSGGQAREFLKEEIKRIDRCLTETLHENRNRALLWLGLGSGMRIVEMTALLIRDVAPHKKVQDFIRLEKHSTKSGKSRTVHISRQTKQCLENYLKQRYPIGIENSDLDDPLFLSQARRKEPLHPRSAIRMFSQMCQVAGISGASTHSMRRTHANALRRRGIDLKIIQEQLGHASLATTERYFFVDPLEKAKAIADLRF